MLDNPDTGRLGDVEVSEGIEIRLSPDCTSGYLLGNLQRAHQRASTLLEELVKTTRKSNPDLEHMRELAMGARFEVELAQTLAQRLVTSQERSAVAK